MLCAQILRVAQSLQTWLHRDLGPNLGFRVRVWGSGCRDLGPNDGESNKNMERDMEIGAYINVYWYSVTWRVQGF